MLGLAVGDAMGTAVEFMPPGTFEPVSGMRGGGPFGLRPGQWTDDTAMALCLAASLIENRELDPFDPKDQMERYVRWYRKGYLSSTGTCFDIGNTTRHALERFERTGEPYSGPSGPGTAGNGSLMRLAPVPLAFVFDPAAAISRAADSSRTTHGAVEAVDACRYMAGLIVGVVNGIAKEELLSPGFAPRGRGMTGLWEREPLTPAVAEVASGSFKAKSPPAIRGAGYVVKSLEAALWAFHVTDSFEDGCLAAVNLGDDADTTAAIYGQLAGAFYGVDALPKPWLEVLAMRDDIVRTASDLLELSGSEGSQDWLAKELIGENE